MLSRSLRTSSSEVGFAFLNSAIAFALLTVGAACTHTRYVPGADGAVITAVLPVQDRKLWPGTVLETTTGSPPTQFPDESRRPTTTLIRSDVSAP